MMSMTRRAPARRRPAINAAPRIDVIQSNTPARTSGGLTALLESATQEILAVTYWFDPAPHAGPYPVTVRFSGRRVDVKGRLQPGDRFAQDETIEQVVPEWPDLTHGPCQRHQSWRVARNSAHAGVRSPCTWATGARERDARGWSARTNRSVLAQMGTVRGIGRTCENLPASLRPGAGDLSRHLGSDGDARHRCRAYSPVPGDFR